MLSLVFCGISALFSLIWSNISTAKIGSKQLESYSRGANRGKKNNKLLENLIEYIKNKFNCAHEKTRTSTT